MKQLHPTVEDIEHLPAQMLSSLLRAAEAASLIQDRSDFFLWEQGPLQALLPHELFVCLSLNETREVEHVEVFHSAVLKPGVLEFFTTGTSAVVAMITDLCAKSSQGFWVFSTNANPKNKLALDNQQLYVVLHDLGFSEGLFKDSGLFGDKKRSIFILLGASPLAPFSRLLTQFLLPHLQTAFLRCIGSNPTTAKKNHGMGSINNSLSERQLEIVHWVKLGKTNFEISVILGISELTVKNHIQNLFKKLNVHNRAQAVAKVFSRA